MKAETKDRICNFLRTLREDPKPTDTECENFHSLVTEIATGKAPAKAKAAKAKK